MPFGAESSESPDSSTEGLYVPSSWDDDDDIDYEPADESLGESHDGSDMDETVFYGWSLRSK